MKKCFIIIILLFFTFGCEANYKLNINKNLSVDEEIIGLENDDFYSNYNGKSKNWVVDALIWNVRDKLKENNYQYLNEESGNLFGEKVYKTFESLDDYLVSSDIYKQLYDTFEHSNESGIVTLNLKDRLPINYDSLTRYRIDTAKVTLVVPFDVIESNADKVDSINHEYTWNIEKNDNKDIYIKFNSKKPLKDKADYLTFIIIAAAILIILLLISKFNKKRMESNNF